MKAQKLRWITGTKKLKNKRKHSEKADSFSIPGNATLNVSQFSRNKSILSIDRTNHLFSEENKDSWLCDSIELTVVNAEPESYFFLLDEQGHCSPRWVSPGNSMCGGSRGNSLGNTSVYSQKMRGSPKDPIFMDPFIHKVLNKGTWN